VFVLGVAPCVKAAMKRPALQPIPNHCTCSENIVGCDGSHCVHFCFFWSVSDVHDFCPLSFVASHHTHYTSPAAAEQCSMEVGSHVVAAAAAEPVASPVPLVAADLQPPKAPSIWLHHVRLHGWRRAYLSLPMAPTLIDAPVMCAWTYVDGSTAPHGAHPHRASNGRQF
jgi:hypothetical protein